MSYIEESRRQAEELRKKDHVRILAIESSCDETAAAVVRDGREVISSVISSQIALHAQYGGVALGWAFTSGRLAGINAVNYLKG